MEDELGPSGYHFQQSASRSMAAATDSPDEDMDSGMGSSSSMTGHVDPSTVMQQLHPALGNTGCIREPKDAPTVVSFMRQSSNQMMVHRCIVLNVIKATDAHNTLAKFMDVGGWSILNNWLSEAKRAQNHPLLLELLSVLRKLPVNIDALKQGNMGKIVKQLTKQDNEAVQSIAAELLSKWMAVFREGQVAKSKAPEERRVSADSDAASAPKSSSSQKKEKEKKSKKKDKGRGSTSDGPPPESVQLPPGPMVALGRPKEKSGKRARDVLGSSEGPQPHAEKRSKPALRSPTDVKEDVLMKEAKPPAKVLVESEGFMNALKSTQATKISQKKVKKSFSKGAKPRTGSTSGAHTDVKQSSAPAKEEEAVEPMEEEVPPIVESGEADTKVPSKKKKRVSWASSEKLTQTFYFELDESERVNVNRSFLDAAHKEKMREREALESGLMFSRDRLMEIIPWKRPFLIELSELVERGSESVEKKVQAERENTVLAQLFLSKASVPPSPLEPDPESEVANMELKLIPLMEPGAPATSGPPANLQPLPPPPNLPPAAFASPTSASAPTSISLPPDSPLPSPATTINQAQSLINFISKQQQQQQHPADPGNVPGSYGGDHTSRHNQASTGYSDHHGRTDHNGAGPGRYHGNHPDYYQNQGHVHQGQGDGPGSTPPHGSGKWMGPEDHGRNYYGGGGGDNYYQGQRGRGFSRGRGRGSFQPWKRGGMVPKLCKHFTTYQGCKLGSRCRFLHCSQEEYNQMNLDQGGGYHGPGGRNFRGRGGHFGGPPMRNFNSRNGEMGGGGAYNHPSPNAAASYSPPYSSNDEGSPHKGKRATYSPPNPSEQPERGRNPPEHQRGQEQERDGQSQGTETT